MSPHINDLFLRALPVIVEYVDSPRDLAALQLVCRGAQDVVFESAPRLNVSSTRWHGPWEGECHFWLMGFQALTHLHLAVTPLLVWDILSLSKDLLTTITVDVPGLWSDEALDLPPLRSAFPLLRVLRVRGRCVRFRFSDLHFLAGLETLEVEDAGGGDAVLAVG